MTRKAILFATLGLFGVVFCGCTSSVPNDATSALKMFNKDIFYDKALKYTKSAQIINSFETKAKISATYLSKLEPVNYGSGEQFLVGIYIVNDDDDAKKSGLNNKNFSLAMSAGDQKIEAKIVKELKNEDELVRRIPHSDNWSRYYIVSFPTEKAQTLTLQYSHAQFGEATLNFSKFGLD
jgi:hypothetical protein